MKQGTSIWDGHHGIIIPEQTLHVDIWIQDMTQQQLMQQQQQRLLQLDQLLLLFSTMLVVTQLCKGPLQQHHHPACHCLNLCPL